jgi:DNA ligase-1
MSLELATFLKECSSEEVEIISYMIQGRVAPMFVKSEFNYSEKSLINILTKHFSLDVNSLRKENGDIGDTVYQLLNRNPSLSENIDIKTLYGILWDIVNTSGVGSVLRKNKIVLECLKKLNPLEGKYFVRTICGELRLGLSVRSLLDVFSISKVGDKGLKEKLEHAYGVCADIGYIGRKVFDSSQESVVERLSKISAIPGTPILSRLVQRVGSFDELSDRFKGNVVVQPKFDGLRCQIHKWKERDDLKDSSEIPIWKEYTKDTTKSVQNLFEREKYSDVNVKLFTRNLEDVTEMFPEIVDSAREIKNDSFILDSEVVGWNYKKKKFLSYQETMQRRRKYSVASMSMDIPVKAFAFDLLFLDGESLVNSDTSERVGRLKNVLEGTLGGIAIADTKVLSGQEEIKGYFNKCVKEGLEGIIVKQMWGSYKPGVRNYEWVKIKKSIDKELVDTIDMVTVGYYKGSGRRSPFGLGAILGAVFNEKDGTYDAICKIGTGMSDEILKEMSKKLKKFSKKEQPKNVRVIDTLIPDVWTLPKYVITVDADEITKNISNKTKLIGGGLSLRFPRLIEFDRDKGVEDITSVVELESMYEMRKKI